MKKIKRINPPKNPLMIILMVILAVYTLVLLGLLFWAFLTSFKNYMLDFMDNKSGWPKEFVFTNYETVFNYIDTTDELKILIDGQSYKLSFGNLLSNTLLYTVGSAFVSAFVPCITAYAVARFSKKFKWLNIFTYLVIITMIIPIVGSTPSEIQIATALGIYDSIWGMFILKGNFLGMYYLVFLGAFKAMPKGYQEAAYIDGAGNFTVFSRIHFPLTLTTFGTIMLIRGIGFWNDYQTPLLYLPTQKTMAQFFFTFIHNNNPDVAFITYKLVGTIILMIPTLILFILLNKRIMGNLSLGGLKE